MVSTPSKATNVLKFFRTFFAFEFGYVWLKWYITLIILEHTTATIANGLEKVKTNKIQVTSLFVFFIEIFTENFKLSSCNRNNMSCSVQKKMFKLCLENILRFVNQNTFELLTKLHGRVFVTNAGVFTTWCLNHQQNI